MTNILSSMHASWQIICFLNRNVSNYTICSVNLLWIMKKGESHSHNFATFSNCSFSNKQNWRERTNSSMFIICVCSLSPSTPWGIILSLFNWWEIEAQRLSNLAKVIQFVKQEILDSDLSWCQSFSTLLCTSTTINHEYLLKLRALCCGEEEVV